MGLCRFNFGNLFFKQLKTRPGFCNRITAQQQNIGTVLFVAMMIKAEGEIVIEKGGKCRAYQLRFCTCKAHAEVRCH